MTSKDWGENYENESDANSEKVIDYEGIDEWLHPSGVDLIFNCRK